MHTIFTTSGKGHPKKEYFKWIRLIKTIPFELNQNWGEVRNNWPYRVEKGK